MTGKKWDERCHQDPPGITARKDKIRSHDCQGAESESRNDQSKKDVKESPDREKVYSSDNPGECKRHTPSSKYLR